MSGWWSGFIAGLVVGAHLGVFVVCALVAGRSEP